MNKDEANKKFPIALLVAWGETPHPDFILMSNIGYVLGYGIEAQSGECLNLIVGSPLENGHRVSVPIDQVRRVNDSKWVAGYFKLYSEA